MFQLKQEGVYQSVQWKFLGKWILMGARVGLEVVQSGMWMSVHIMYDFEQVT